MPRNIGPIHPGEILKEEFLEPLGVSMASLANAINTDRRRVCDIVAGRRGITADTAIRFGIAFDTTPQFWLNLQNQYDLERDGLDQRELDQIEVIAV